MAPQQSASTGPFTAVVTGASGFVPGEVVKQLLSTGWNVSLAIASWLARMPCLTLNQFLLVQVRGTVRSLSNKDKTAHLTKLSEVSSSRKAIRCG